MPTGRRSPRSATCLSSPIRTATTRPSRSCAGCARTTGMCLNILGIKFEHVNENQYMHQWARVKVGKEYWICDPFGLYAGKEPGKRKHPYFK